MRVLVTVAFFVISAWTAKDVLAECAWVLWEHIERSDVNLSNKTYEVHSDWTLHRAYEKNDLCESGKGRVWEVEADKYPASPQGELKKVPGEMLMLTIKAKDGGNTTWTHTFFCLPDSIDPRGRKGS